MHLYLNLDTIRRVGLYNLLLIPKFGRNIKKKKTSFNKVCRNAQTQRNLVDYDMDNYIVRYCLISHLKSYLMSVCWRTRKCLLSSELYLGIRFQNGMAVLNSMLYSPFSIHLYRFHRRRITKTVVSIRWMMRPKSILQWIT